MWLNGTLILSRDVDRAVRPNQDHAELKLKNGENKLLMKINNNAGDSGFYFSLTGVGPKELIWTIIEDDFTKPADALEISWTRKDKIWDEDWTQGDLSPAAKKYAFVVSQISEKEGNEIVNEATGPVSFHQIISIHDKYIEARKSEYHCAYARTDAKPRINGARVFGVRPNHPFNSPSPPPESGPWIILPTIFRKV